MKIKDIGERHKANQKRRKDIGGNKMKYLIKEDYSYERSLGSDTEDTTIAIADNIEEAEQIIESYDKNTQRFLYIEEEEENEILLY